MLLKDYIADSRFTWIFILHIYLCFSTLLILFHMWLPTTFFSESISLESSFNCDVLLELTA